MPVRGGPPGLPHSSAAIHEERGVRVVMAPRGPRASYPPSRAFIGFSGFRRVCGYFSEKSNPRSRPREARGRVPGDALESSHDPHRRSVAAPVEGARVPVTGAPRDGPPAHRREQPGRSVRQDRRVSRDPDPLPSALRALPPFRAPRPEGVLDDAPGDVVPPRDPTPPVHWPPACSSIAAIMRSRTWRRNR